MRAKLILASAFIGAMFLSPALGAGEPAIAVFDRVNDMYRAGSFLDVIKTSDDAMRTLAMPDELRAGFYHLEGSAHARLGKFKDAIADYDHALALPIFDAGIRADVLWERGLAKAYGKSCTDAIADYNAALDIDPTYAAALAERGRCEAAGGDTEAAKADLDAALKFEPRQDEWIALRQGLN